MYRLALAGFVVACHAPQTETRAMDAPHPTWLATAEPGVEASASVAPTSVASVASVASAASAAPATPVSVCGADSHRQWTCGRPSGRAPADAGQPVAFADCPGDGVSISHEWRMVSFPGAMQPDEARTRSFRERRTDEVGHLVHDVCCYSACVKLEVRASGDAPPADQVVAPLCIAALETASTVPAPGRADCAAAIRLPGYGTFGAFDAARTEQDGLEWARRAGFPKTPVCCYEGLRPKNATR